jgi:linoleoyl-CoA desaturase
MNNAVTYTSAAPKAPVYAVPEDKGFASVLRARVDQYFKESHRSPRGGAKITLKVIIILGLFAGSYALMLSNLFTPAGTLAFAVLFGISQVLIVFTMAHDASHQSLFNSRRLNKVFTYTFNLLGANAYLWNITHNQIHHTYPNVGEYDTDIQQQAPLIRVSPSVPLKYYHRFQPYYAPVLYMFYSLFLVFQKDFQDIGLLPKTDSPLLRLKKPPRKEYVIFFISKILYITYTVVIPWMVLNVTVMQFVIGYLTVHFIMSLLLSLVLIPVHMVDEAPFAMVGPDHIIHDSWMLHVAKNTVDYSRKSKLANWFFGGLNTHLVHHIFPGICHVHYIPMSEIVKQTCKEFGIAYHEVSMAEAVRSHFRLLKRMSHA